MIRYLFASALAVALAGCASVDDLRTKDPVYFATTAKSPQQYGECLVTGWRGLDKEATVATRPIRNGVDVYTQGRFNVEEVVRVQHYDNITHINMYTRTPYHFQELMQAANLCL